MNLDYEKMSAFNQIKSGLQEAISHARGEMNLRTTTLPAPPPSMPPANVVQLRKRLGMSQRVFAAYLNVSPKLVQTWEQGTRVPRGGALRLLELIDRDPALIFTVRAASLSLRGASQKRSRNGRSAGAKPRRRVA